MAAVKTLVGAKLIIQVEDDTTPGTFAADCIINASRGITFSSETKEFTVPDCADPTLPGFKQLFKEGLSCTVSGGGMLHTTSFERWFNWMNSDAEKNIRVKLDVAAADGGGYIAGAFKLTGFEASADGNKDLTTASITLQSHGAYTWTDAV